MNPSGQQYDAVHNRLFQLPDATVVWPGHDYRGGKSSTIGDEKRGNPRYTRSRAEYVASSIARSPDLISSGASAAARSARRPVASRSLASTSAGPAVFKMTSSAFHSALIAARRGR